MTIQALETKYANELEYLNSLFSELGITVKNTILVVSIDNAYTAIKNYLRLNADADCAAYFSAACELATAYYNNELVALKKASGARAVTQKTEGSRSATFGQMEITIDNRGVTDKVKALLPYPPIFAV